MALLLRDGSETQDPRLDRLIQFDERSRAWPVRQLVEDKPPRSYRWPFGPLLNQGNEGGCCGAGTTNEINGFPKRQLPPKTYEWARENIYFPAQRIDPWEGGQYPGASPYYEGTSVLSAVKIAQQLGAFKEYRWAFTLMDVVRGLGYEGGGLAGLDWHEGMMNPEPDGRIRPTGDVLGGHCIYLFGVWIPLSWRPDGRIWMYQSWGNHGLNGTGVVYMTWDDFETVQHHDGEVVFPVNRALIA